MLKIHLLVLNVSAPVPEMMVLPRKDQVTPVARGAATALHTSWGERPAAAACTARYSAVLAAVECLYLNWRGGDGGGPA